MSFRDRVGVLTAKGGFAMTYKRHTGRTKVDALTYTNTYADKAFTGSVRTYSPKEVVGQVQQGDRELRIAANALPYTPTVKDRVVIDTKVYDILSVNPLAAKGEIALHVLQIRGL